MSTRETPRPWQGLAIAIAPDRVVVSAPAAALLVRIIDAYCRKVDAQIRMPPHLREVRNVLASVAVERDSGHADVRNYPDPASSSLSVAWVGTEEAAQMLGVTREHVGRLARAGLLGVTTLRKGKRLVSRTEVEAYRRTSSERTSA